MKIIGVIPARYGSKRFPGKPLALINGKPMIQWVYEKASKSKYLERLIVATDDVRIMRKVWSFGGEAMLTSLKSKSGTDRTAEVCKKMAADVIVNIQGDEPLISYKTIDLVVEAMKKDQRLLMATAAIPLKSTKLETPYIFPAIPYPIKKIKMLKKRSYSIAGSMLLEKIFCYALQNGNKLP